MALVHDSSNIASAVLMAPGDMLFFPGDDGVDGEWRSASDTTERSVRPDPDTLSASGGMDRAGAGVGHGFVFAADDGVHGIALWTSDGTEVGTRRIRPISR